MSRYLFSLLEDSEHPGHYGSPCTESSYAASSRRSGGFFIPTLRYTVGIELCVMRVLKIGAARKCGALYFEAVSTGATVSSIVRR